MMLAGSRPQIHGHRGARGLRPENTLVSVQAGIDSGCDAIEVDLCVTRDDELVLLHDPVLSPHKVREGSGNWIDGQIRVRQLDMDQVREFDVGKIRPESGYANKFPDQAGMDGVQIPTLDEFRKFLVEAGPDILVNLELKSTPYDKKAIPDIEYYAGLVADGIQLLKQTHEVVVQSFDWRIPAEIRKLVPGLLTGFTTDNQPWGDPVSPVSGSPSPWTNFRDLRNYDNDLPLMIHSMGANIWSSNYRDLTPENIDRAKQLGLKIYAWTVNTLEDMETMIEWQVDAIITDYPDRLHALLF